MPRVYNFSAGPAMMPEAVLLRAAAEISDFGATGMSVMEMSHRSKDYISIFSSVEDKLRAAMDIPKNYKVLFLQGGATLQFSAVPMNLLGANAADYAITGYFSKKAYSSARLFGDIRVAADTGNYYDIPDQAELTLNPDAAYFHFCHNNTVYGTRWHYLPATGSVPLVCDMSSSILSESIDVSRFGVIYAGAQKNMGPAGVTVVIVREDLLEREALPCAPELLRYRAQAENGSMLNTPPTYGVYLLGLMLDWLEESGGVAGIEKLNRQKAALLYSAVDDSPVFNCKIAKRARSIMNVVFSSDSDEIDSKFLKAAAAEGLATLKAHRATGGIRASIYNAMPLEGVEKLAELMKSFK